MNSNNMHPIKLKNGKLVTDPEEIRDYQKCYFEDLYTPKDLNMYDNDFRDVVENAIVDMEYESYSNDDVCMSYPISRKYLILLRD